MNSAPRHLVVWLDHRLARIFSLTRENAQEILIHSPDLGKGHVHHHAGTPGPGHNSLVPEFMESISRATGNAEQILLLGPAQARHELKAFLDLHKPNQSKRISGSETLDSGSEAQIVGFARQFFARADRMATTRR